MAKKSKQRSARKRNKSDQQRYNAWFIREVVPIMSPQTICRILATDPKAAADIVKHAKAPRILRNLRYCDSILTAVNDDPAVDIAHFNLHKQEEFRAWSLGLHQIRGHINVAEQGKQNCQTRSMEWCKMDLFNCVYLGAGSNQ